MLKNKFHVIAQIFSGKFYFVRFPGPVLKNAGGNGLMPGAKYQPGQFAEPFSA